MRKILSLIIVIALTACSSSKKAISTSNTSTKIDSSVINIKTDEAEVVEIEWNITNEVLKGTEYSRNLSLSKNDTAAGIHPIPLRGHITISKTKKINSDSASIKKNIVRNAENKVIKNSKQNADKMLNKSANKIYYIFIGIIIIAICVKIWLRYKNNIKKFLDIPD